MLDQIRGVNVYCVGVVSIEGQCQFSFAYSDKIDYAVRY